MVVTAHCSSLSSSGRRKQHERKHRSYFLNVFLNALHLMLVDQFCKHAYKQSKREQA